MSASFDLQGPGVVLCLLYPTAMMSRREASQCRRLGRRIAQIRARRDAWHLPPALEKNVARLRAEIKEVCRTTFERETDLRKYCVVEADTPPGPVRLQVLEFDLSAAEDPPVRWLWTFEGPLLRRDGAIGCKRKRVTAWYGVVRRRGLDGAWRAVRRARDEHAT